MKLRLDLFCLAATLPSLSVCDTTAVSCLCHSTPPTLTTTCTSVCSFGFMNDKCSPSQHECVCVGHKLQVHSHTRRRAAGHVTDLVDVSAAFSRKTKRPRPLTLTPHRRSSQSCNERRRKTSGAELNGTRTRTLLFRGGSASFLLLLLSVGSTLY